MTEIQEYQQINYKNIVYSPTSPGYGYVQISDELARQWIEIETAIQKDSDNLVKI